jgi:DNA-directed RNA polymerase specialized sigma24 family protein
MHRDLVERARAGDHDAFEALTAAAFDRLYAVARRILRDRDRCDDAVQECLVRA